VNIALIDVKGNDNRSIANSIAMNIRNMVCVSDLLSGMFFYNARQLKKIKNDFDILVFGFGGISANIEQVRDFVKQKKPKKIYWLVTEYDSTNPSLYYACKELNMEYISIQNMLVKDKFPKYCANQIMLNLNLLISRPVNELKEKKYDCVYYSRWRPNRAKYLKEYLKEDIYFSSDSKNFKHHKHIGCNPKFIKKLSWTPKKETLNLFKYQLYLEDERTHKVFNNLANRYYEAGFCNNVVFFDVNCRNTINKSELSYYKEQVEYYMVKDYKDLQNKIKECNKDFNKHLAIQKSWRMNEATARTNMLKELKNIIYNGTE
jgi:hypothetical protein